MWRSGRLCGVRETVSGWEAGYNTDNTMTEPCESTAGRAHGRIRTCPSPQGRLILVAERSGSLRSYGIRFGGVPGGDERGSEDTCPARLLGRGGRGVARRPLVGWRAILATTCRRHDQGSLRRRSHGRCGVRSRGRRRWCIMWCSCSYEVRRGCWSLD